MEVPGHDRSACSGDLSQQPRSGDTAHGRAPWTARRALSARSANDVRPRWRSTAGHAGPRAARAGDVRSGRSTRTFSWTAEMAALRDLPDPATAPSGMGTVKTIRGSLNP